MPIKMMQNILAKHLSIYTTNYHFSYKDTTNQYIEFLSLSKHYILIVYISNIQTVRNYQTTSRIVLKVFFWKLCDLALFGDFHAVPIRDLRDVWGFLSYILPSWLPHIPSVMSVQDAQNANRITFPAC